MPKPKQGAPPADTDSAEFQNYYLGIDPASECPATCVHVGGVEFPQFSEHVKVNGGHTSRTQIPGVVKRLLAEEITYVKAAMEKKFFRGNRLMTKDTPNYRPWPGDKPLKGFLYIRPLNAIDALTMPVPEGAIPNQADNELAKAQATERLARLQGGSADAAVRKGRQQAKAFGQTVDRDR